ncbi:HAD-IIB family hydrolase [Beijerinckia indica]|uniref:HAD-superfamily hydrolase, subfamily IIB n=1 Tax=Beijerinckia indica subsp. indica (strain ATCC 9039 / DSM 1715 / NCIMB 8712) TaxID=395963 RepID=B2IGS6_BEII9|nr:HAD-IIB family hydrolase [Beijerinckia indica]ACB95837.1 HAD-superfamily hydrolase, subfamily IIB [Beijerinckia indica subsp. indica ATCC 9039]
MKDLATADRTIFTSVRFVLTDMDETLTYKGRLAARTYEALERLQNAGVRVIPVTGAPAGWCDQMARMWPVDGVIGENGGLFIQRSQDHGVIRLYWHSETDRPRIAERLAAIGREVQQQVPSARWADDQPFRLTSLAFARPDDRSVREEILATLRTAGADTTVNNLWVLGWLGGYDKLTMARRVMADVYGVNIDEERDAILYSGDSTNDAPMFGFFRHTIGMSTVRHYLDEIPTLPAWITAGPGGEGFVEIADALLVARA